MARGLALAAATRSTHDDGRRPAGQAPADGAAPRSPPPARRPGSSAAGGGSSCPAADWFEPPARLPAAGDTVWQVAVRACRPGRGAAAGAARRRRPAGGHRGARLVASAARWPRRSRRCSPSWPRPASTPRPSPSSSAARLHRTTTAAEKDARWSVRRRAGVTVVDAQGLEQVSVDLGRTADGTPVLVNEHVAAADLVITRRRRRAASVRRATRAA